MPFTAAPVDTTLRYASSNIGLNGGNNMVMLSDGTLLLGYVKTNGSLTIAYSTDKGATWADCATTIAISPAQGHAHSIAVDQNDQCLALYLASGGQGAVRPFTFTGSNITLNAAEYLAGGGWERGGIIAVQSPTQANETAFITSAHSSANGYVVTGRYNRTTFTFSGIATLLGPVSTQVPWWPVLRSSTTSKVIPRNTSNPEVFQVDAGASGQLKTIYKYDWDATNHRFKYVVGIGANVTDYSAPGNYSGGIVYNPVDDKIYYFYAGSSGATECKWMTFNPASATWTNVDSDLALATTYDGLEGQVAKPVVTKSGAMRAYSHEATGTSSTTVGFRRWGGTAFDGSEETNVASIALTYTSYPTSLWNANHEVAGFWWVEPDTGFQYAARAIVMSLSQGDSVGVDGWGMVPM